MFATQLVAAEQSMEDLKRSHDEALQAAEQARGAVEQSRMRLQTTLAERTKLMSQLEQAKMQEHVAASMRQVNELSAPGNTPTLSEVRGQDRGALRERSRAGRAGAVLRRGPDARGREGHPGRRRRSRLDQIRAPMSAPAAVEGGPAAPAIEQGTAAGARRRESAARPAERPEPQA